MRELLTEQAELDKRLSPDFIGEIKRAVLAWESFEQRPFGFYYEATPGQVIYEASPEERAILDDPSKAGIETGEYGIITGFGLPEFKQFFPGMDKAIEDDLAIIGASQTGITPNSNVQLRSGITKKNEEITPEDDPLLWGWHIDGTNYIRYEGEQPERVPHIIYVVSNRDTTEEYVGPASASFMGLYNAQVLHRSMDGRQLKGVRPENIHRAGEYQLVRLNPFSYHREPLFEEPGQRSFLRIVVNPTVDWQIQLVESLEQPSHR